MLEKAPTDRTSTSVAPDTGANKQAAAGQNPVAGSLQTSSEPVIKAPTLQTNDLEEVMGE